MPVPSEYQRASLDFDKFMVDARDIAGLATTNMAWNMVVSVLHTFRPRLDVRDAARFANVLPPILRASEAARQTPGRSRPWPAPASPDHPCG